MVTVPKSWPERITLAVGVLAGALSLASYFFPRGPWIGPAQFLLKTTMLTFAGALLLGVGHLLWRHWPGVRQKQAQSLLLWGGFLLMFLAGMAMGGFRVGLAGWLYHWALAPGMAAVFALIPIFMAYALWRHLSVRDVGGVLFLAGLILVLMGQIPGFLAFLPGLAVWRRALLVGPVAAAFRGVLLGVALGSILAFLIAILTPRR